MNNKKIFISVGEASGDLHASNLVKKITQNTNAPHVHFSGMGGKLMRQAGVNIIVDSTNLAVIGAIEILHHLGQFIKARRTIKRELTNNPPHLLILIDYPGFNLWLAKIAKKMGIKTLYYISPQIWAWHQSRIKKIRRYVDMMAVVFPFEVPFYANANVPVTLVRHPLLDIVKPTMEKDIAKSTFDIDQQATPIIGLFPGSRKNEIKYLLPIMLQAAVLLKNKFPNIKFILPLASSLSADDLKPYLQPQNIKSKHEKYKEHKEHAKRKDEYSEEHEEYNEHDDCYKNCEEYSCTNLPNLGTSSNLDQNWDSNPDKNLNILVIKNRQYDVVNICDAIIATSGTVTLEITLLAIPMVIIYKLASITYWLIKQVIKIPYIGLCNIIANKKIVLELIQRDANAINISQEVEKILENKIYREQMITELQQVKQQLELTQEKNKKNKEIDELVLELVTTQAGS